MSANATFDLTAEIAKANADYFANAPSIVRECRCRVYPYPHEFGLGDCGELLKRCADVATVDAGDDYAADHRADSPTRGQAAGLNALARRQRTGDL